MVGLDPDVNRDEECGENIGLGCALEHFSEVEEVMDMIDNVKNIYNLPMYEVEYDKLYNILKQYYEQPHLLDPHLDKILAKFLNLIKDKELPFEFKHAVFNYMYQIIRVRGYKVVVRHLPHEVSDLLTVLTFLEAQDPNDKETWRSRFVLLLWLSIVVIIPFHMSRLDGFAPGLPNEGTSKKLTVMERIFNICKTYALSKDACAEVNAYLTSKFLTRSDVKELYMEPFFTWACELNSNMKDDDIIHYGVLAAVAAVLNHGKRDDLLPFASKLLEWVTNQNYKTHKAMLVRKYGVKIVQRIGLTFLRPRVAAWRYTRGSRSLGAALSGAAAGDTEPLPLPAEEDHDIPQEVEETVELLLWSLRDDDTVVRWSAAKGAGRIGARLPPALAADVAGCVLALFAPAERETAWHGGCMALAELARRGLLSPAQLGQGVAGVVAPLRRDEPRGLGGGRASRDAACHAAWAFARAYDPDALKPYAATLANALIATACFDREINCRRAASAAFQENVGRHGMFPHGIEVLTVADFQSVGPRAAAYLAVAPLVARQAEYAVPMVDHLLDLKLEHWDCAIRELAAAALGKLTPEVPSYVATVVVPKLVEKAGSCDLATRHGAVLAVGEAVLALAQTKLEDGSTADAQIPAESSAGVHALAARLEARQQFRGLGGELMRQAVCRAVGCLARADAPRPAAAVESWLALISESLAHEVPAVRAQAARALPPVLARFLRGEEARGRRAELVEKYCEQLSNTGVNGLVLRMGHARAIGCLPKFVLEEHLPLVVSSLAECARVTDETRQWAEARRDAVLGLTEVCDTVGVSGALAPLLDSVLTSLLTGLQEYTLDVRGDVGAWVREASMTGLLAVCRRCAAEAPALLPAEAVAAAAAGAAQQAVEKIDRTRAIAGRVFTQMIYNDPPIPHIPQHEALKRIFPAEDLEPGTDSPAAPGPDGKAPGPDDKAPGPDGKAPAASESCGAVLWLFPGHTMPRFVRLLDFPEYRDSVLKGLVVSAGEMTESLVKHTTAALFAYLRSSPRAQLAAVCAGVLRVFAAHLHVRRVAGPMFNFLDRLLSSGAISPILEDPSSTFALDVLKYLQLELKGAKNIYKLLDSINVLCQLIQVGGEVCSKALGLLVIYLCYADRYVRRVAAARLYEAFTLYEDALAAPPDNVDQAKSILADTDWERDVAELRPLRNQLCDLLLIRRPVLRQRNP